MSYVAFDLGNVLFHVDLKPIEDELTFNRGNFDNNVYFKRFWYSDNSYQFLEDHQTLIDNGILTLEQSIRKTLQYPYDTGRFSTAWNKCVTLNEAMANFLLDIKSQGLKVAFLSNIGHEHAEHITTTYPEIFKDTVCHFSCEVGSRKPQHLFYQSFLFNHEEFSGAPFIDDKRENLQAAKKYKFEDYHFELDKFMELSQSKQKEKLDQMKRLILDRRMDNDKV